MEALFKRLYQGTLVALWVASATLLYLWSPVLGIGFLALALPLLLWALRRPAGVAPPQRRSARSAAELERQARVVVTQMLRALTTVQVGYLSQRFSDRAEGRAWLHRALPKSFRAVLETLQADLEAARDGTPPPGLKLALRLLERRTQLQEIEAALEAARHAHPECALARPMAFVVTEHIHWNGDREPEVLLVANVDPTKATLVPTVDAVTFLAPKTGGGTRIRGQVDFATAQRLLDGHLAPLEGSPGIFLARPIPEPQGLDARLGQLPLGFLVAASEMSA
ncbi:MAG: hypothetical protein IT371_24420 [Deltaproteobacteria bacterium]|nr:hypothetical protein [Deltaproteobacteria bacterium]